MNRLRVTSALCKRTRDQFSAYLDGELTGRDMNTLAEHMKTCVGCREDFAAWRQMSDSLATAGRVQPPANLQARLRAAIHTERVAETHLPTHSKLSLFWARTIAPLLRDSIGPVAMRATAGLVIAASLLGGLTFMFSGSLSVEANDDKMAKLSAPHYMYSEVPPEPIATHNDAPILVEAAVDAQGRIYDFRILEGPTDPTVRTQIEKNLVTSLFHPATVFGEPVRGHVMLTFTGVSVHG